MHQREIHNPPHYSHFKLKFEAREVTIFLGVVTVRQQMYSYVKLLHVTVAVINYKGGALCHWRVFELRQPENKVVERLQTLASATIRRGASG
jgi:hypothetical protein